MHYANGREAKNGDMVALLSPYPNTPPTVGILYNATAGNDYCNGRIAPVSASDPCPNLKEVLHVDDLKAKLGDIAAVPNSAALSVGVGTDASSIPVKDAPTG